MKTDSYVFNNVTFEKVWYDPEYDIMLFKGRERPYYELYRCKWKTNPDGSKIYTFKFDRDARFICHQDEAKRIERVRINIEKMKESIEASRKNPRYANKS